MTDGLRAGLALRWSRAAVLAAVAAGFAGAAHTAADGSLPRPGALLVLVVAATIVLAPLLGRPASTLRVATLLTGGQAVLHAVFTASGGHPGATGGPAVTSAAGGGAAPALPQGRLADALVAPGLLDTASSEPSWLAHAIGHLQADLASPAAQRMAVAHLLAAAALGVWLAAGERLAWRLVLLLAGPAARSLAIAAARVRTAAAATSGGWTRPAHLAAGAVAARSRWPERAPLLAALLALEAPRRGPPVSASA